MSTYTAEYNEGTGKTIGLKHEFHQWSDAETSETKSCRGETECQTSAFVKVVPEQERARCKSKRPAKT